MKKDKKYYKARADRLFSLWVRQRDAVSGVCRCITCNALHSWRTVHCGHFMSRRYEGTRYNENNRIILSYTHYWPNINMVTLMHEFLHSIIPFNIISHAIIELATNNELRIRLNKKEKYFVQSLNEKGKTFIQNFNKKEEKKNDSQKAFFRGYKTGRFS